MFKTNYFLRNMVDLNINSLNEYIKNTPYNFVIIVDNIPLIWGGDSTPVIYGGKEDLYAELDNLYADNGKKNNIEVITEWEFINKYCIKDITDYLISKIKKHNVFDGTNFIIECDDSFNNIINLNDMTDILTIYANDKELTFLISNNDDTKRDFVFLTDFAFHIIVKIIKYIENNTQL